MFNFYTFKLSDLNNDAFIEHTLADLVYHVASEGNYEI
jgi:hypothetical protein